MDEVADVVDYEKCGAFGTENALIMQGRGRNFLINPATNPVIHGGEG